MSSQKKHLSGNKISLKILNKGQQYQSDSLTKKKTEKVEKPRCKSGVGKTITGKLNTNNNDREMNALLKESYNLLKQENEALSHQLRRKARKIEEMKEALKVCQTRLACYEQMIALLKNKGESSTEAEDTLSASRKKFQEMIREAQDIAKASIDKYKKIEKEMEEEKSRHQEQVLRLKEENRKLKDQRQSPSTVSTNHKRKQQNSHSEESADKDKELKALKIKQLQWGKKEESLRSMLADIGNKVESYQRLCRATEEKAKMCKIEMDSWKEKYENKCKKNKESNQKWRLLFGDLMKQTVETKKEIEAVKKMLLRLIKNEARQLSQS